MCYIYINEERRIKKILKYVNLNKPASHCCPHNSGVPFLGKRKRDDRKRSCRFELSAHLLRLMLDEKIVFERKKARNDGGECVMHW